MDVNNAVAAIAFGIRFIQMYQDYVSSAEMYDESKNAILLSLLATSFLLIFQVK